MLTYYTLQHPAQARGTMALKKRTDVQTTFFCLSNSNSVYIDTILKVRHTALHCCAQMQRRPFPGRDEMYIELIGLTLELRSITASRRSLTRL